MHRTLTLVTIAALGLVAGCQEPLQPAATLSQLTPSQVGVGTAPATGQLILKVGRVRGVQYVRVQDWERATASLVNTDPTIPPLGQTLAATVDAQLGRSASFTFAPVKPATGYTLTIDLERRNAAGTWQAIASGTLSNFALASGTNTLSVPLTLTASGQLTVSVPSPALPPMPTITDYFPTSGSVGMRIQLDGTGFAATPAGDVVKFNGTSATVLSGNTTTLQAEVPAGATTGSILLTVNGWSAASSTFTVVPTGTVIGTFNVGTGPSGVTTDSAGNIWVANKTSNNVTKLSRKGVLIGTYGAGAGPHGIAVDASDNVWVANNNGTSVSKLDNAGNLLNTYGVGAGPMDIAFDGSGNAWVTVNGANLLAKITPGGTVTTVGTGTEPRSVAVDTATGDIWISSKGDSLSKYTSAGVLANKYGMGAEAWGLALNLAGGFVWGTDFNNNNVHKYTLATGALINKTGSGDNSKDLVLDLAGNAWVVQPGTNKVAKMSTANALVGNYAVGTTPSAIALAPSGALLVTNFGSNNVMMVAP